MPYCAPSAIIAKRSSEPQLAAMQAVAQTQTGKDDVAFRY